jgi:hypothetical protein
MDINHVPYDFEVGKSNARRAKNAPLHASLFDDRDLLDQSLKEVLSEENVRMHDDQILVAMPLLHQFNK